MKAKSVSDNRPAISIIDDEYEKIIDRFKSQIMPELMDNLFWLRINTTGNLRDSLHMQIDKGDDVWEIGFTMAVKGKIIHQKERFAQHASPQDLAEWVKTKGLGNFQYVPGYEKTGRIPDDAAERIAWAIKKSRAHQRHRTYTPPGYNVYALDYNGFASWFYKPYFSKWRSARVELVDTYFTTTSEVFAKEVAKSYSVSA